jgi:hypothetical protein
MVEGFVDTRTSMLIMLIVVVRELGIMHLVTSMEFYKIASRVVTQALSKINEIAIRVGEVQCLMTFMVVNIGSYDLLFRLDFLIKIGIIVDVEKGTIQVR